MPGKGNPGPLAAARASEVFHSAAERSEIRQAPQIYQAVPAPLLSARGRTAAIAEGAR